MRFKVSIIETRGNNADLRVARDDGYISDRRRPSLADGVADVGDDVKEGKPSEPTLLWSVRSNDHLLLRISACVPSYPTSERRS